MLIVNQRYDIVSVAKLHSLFNIDKVRTCA